MTPILLKTTTDNQYFIYKRNILSEMKSSNCSIIINQIWARFMWKTAVNRR